MSATNADVERIRRMAADQAPGEYSDAELAAVIEGYPLDSGYDLNAAAAEVWGLKAAAYAGSEERVTVDGATFDYGALMAKALRMQRHYSSQASETYREYGSAQMLRGDIADEALGTE